MRLLDFSGILYRAAQLAGLDRSSLNNSTFALLRDFASGRLGWVWEHEPWVETTRIAEAAVVTSGVGLRTVTLGENVGDVFQVWNKDPRLGTTARAVQYFLYGDGDQRLINIVDPSGYTTVFLEYRAARPLLFGDPWSASVAYEVGAQAYFDPGTASGSLTPGEGKAPVGNLYECIVATTAGQSPSTASLSWQRVEIPAAFEEYLVRGVVADYWRAEGQFDKAQVAENDATAAVERLVDVQARQQGQIARLNVWSY